MYNIFPFFVLVLLCGCSDFQARPQLEIQDTERAAQYFADELNFKTNPAGVKKEVLNSNSQIVIVDVRDEESYKKAHIPRSINLSFKKYNSFDGPETEYPGLSRDHYNYVYCYEEHCNLGQKAAKKFASLGYPVKEMVGGFNSWVNHNYSVEN